jgi:hypothetical protein
VSLILDALRKLERDKDAREPGVLVVGSVPWGARTRSRRPLLLALAGVALLGLLAFAFRRPSRPPAQAEPVTPAATPTAATLPPPSPSPTAAAAARLAAPRPQPTPPEARRESFALPAGPAPVDVPPATGEEEQGAGPTVASEPAPAGTLRLNAISQRDGRPVALINDRLVFEGDSFDGFKVLRIGEAEVEVEVHGRRRVLRF